MKDLVFTLTLTVSTFACSVVQVVWHCVIQWMEDGLGYLAQSGSFEIHLLPVAGGIPQSRLFAWCVDA